MLVIVDCTWGSNSEIGRIMKKKDPKGKNMHVAIEQHTGRVWTKEA